MNLKLYYQKRYLEDANDHHAADDLSSSYLIFNILRAPLGYRNKIYGS